MARTVDRRMQALRRYQILDTTPDESFDALTRLASAICKAPISAVSFVDVNRQWFKSEVGLGVRSTSLSNSFCRHAIEQDGTLIVRDALLDPRFERNDLVISEPKLRFYAGCALKAPNGVAVGTLCVLDTKPRPEGLSPTELSALEVLARQVEAQLELRLALLERDAQVTALRDLTEKLEHLGSHDALTDLPNRGLFVATLEQELRNCERRGASMALLLLDLDHFKQVNDSLGHDAGDALLRGLARKLRSAVRGTDTVARLGGDEFAIILADLKGEDLIPGIIGKLSDRLKVPVRHRGRTLECRASIGVATYPKDARTAEHLFKCSDLALAAAKLTRGRAVNFEQQLLEDFDAQLSSAASIRQSLADDTFAPFYQPKINLGNGERIGFEALLRWGGSDDNVGRLNVFDAMFPDKSLVAQIGTRMMEKILDDVDRWTKSGLHFGHIAINSSAVDFASNDFAEVLLQKLRTRNISPKSIEIEVTEGVLVGRGAPHVARALKVLRGAGVSIALDDFGTGFASLTHLQQFPIDVLKIDRSFISGITRSVDDAAIVRAVIGLAKNLGMATVAEGVETVAQSAFVQHHGCDYGQGFLYGAAISAREIEDNELSQEMPSRSSSRK